MSELQAVEEKQTVNEAGSVTEYKKKLANTLEEKRDVIRNTVASSANNNELEMFMHLAKQYGLDPFQGEIYFWKSERGPTIMTSRDGYLKIANTDYKDVFDGMDSGVIYPGDEFKKTSDGGVDHELNIENINKQPLAGYAVVYRTDRKMPTRVIVPFKDYYQSNKHKDSWQKYPSAMIQKVAEAMCLKRAFSISGLVSKEEMGYEQGNNQQQFTQQNAGNNNQNNKQKKPNNKPGNNQNGTPNKQKQKIINEIGNKVNDETDPLSKQVVQDQMKNIVGIDELDKITKLSLDELQELKEVCVDPYIPDAKEVEVIDEDDDIAEEAAEAIDLEGVE